MIICDIDNNGADVGSYGITFATNIFESDNYKFEITNTSNASNTANAELEITKGNSILTYLSESSSVYGDSNIPIDVSINTIQDIEYKKVNNTCGASIVSSSTGFKLNSTSAGYVDIIITTKITQTNPEADNYKSITESDEKIIRHTVEKAELTFTFKNDSRDFGDPDPVFVFESVTGFVNGELDGYKGDINDKISELIKEVPKGITDAFLSSPERVGYKIFVDPNNTGIDDNYYFSFVNAKLAITQDKPLVITKEETAEITQTSAKLFAAIEKKGISDITEIGFIWSIADDDLDKNDTDVSKERGRYIESVIIATLDPDPFPFEYDIENLPEGTNIYYRAFTENKEGISYGIIRSFVTEKIEATIGNFEDFYVTYGGDNIDLLVKTGITRNSTGNIYFTVKSSYGTMILNDFLTLKIGNVEQFTLTANIEEHGVYSSVSESIKVQVEKAKITAIPKDTTRFYYEENPEIKIEYTGLKNGDNPNITLNIAPRASTSELLDLNSDIGEYVINLSDDSFDNNYNIDTSSKAKFIIKADRPIVKTLSVEDVTSSSFLVNSKTISNGGIEIIEQGHYWATKISDLENKMVSKTSGYFNNKLNELKPNTLIYIQSYSINSEGESKGNILEVITKKSSPSVTIHSELRDITYSDFQIIFSFSDYIEGFNINDIQIENAEIENLTTLDNQTYKADIILIKEGFINVSIPKDKVYDNQNNYNLESEIYTIEYRTDLLADTDNDGILNIDEDQNKDGDIFNDDCDEDGIPNYKDTDFCPIETITPKIFSPNNDGINDSFVIKEIEVHYPDFQIIVYDINGRALFNYKHNGNTNKEPIWWTGKINNSENLVPDDTYFYTINYNRDNVKSKSGWIQVSTK